MYIDDSKTAANHTNVVPLDMLAHRLRRLADINTTLGQWLSNHLARVTL